MLPFFNADTAPDAWITFGCRLSAGQGAAMDDHSSSHERGTVMPGRSGNGRSRGVAGVWAGALILVTVWAMALLVSPLAADDAYYRTLLPEILPPTPAPTGQPGVCDKLFGLGRLGRPQRMVVYADKPRQAAEAALRDPKLGVTMAGYALAAGAEADHANVSTCVDLYFETVAFSWNFLQSRGAAAQPEYELAWQIYHNGLARLMTAAQRFGRLDPSKGLRVVTAAGALTIPVVHHGFVWKAEDFTRVEILDCNAPEKLRCHYTRAGLGVPLVVIRESRPPERFLDDITPFGATVVLRPSLAVLAGTAPPLGAGSSHGPVEFYDPLRVSCVTVGEQQIAMASDTSAALEYMLKDERCRFWHGLGQSSTTEAGQEKLFMLEPRQPGKFPLVLVHGFFSSPAVFADVVNEIYARPNLRNCYQVLAYRYPTERPFVASAAVLRRELNAFVKTYDSQEQDPAMYNMAMIGHSMGGLIAKLMVTHSDDRLWHAIANRPLNEIKASPDVRQRLSDMFYFEPLPYVRRVIFLGAPHDGAMMASRAIGRISSHCVVYSTADRLEHNQLIKDNPDVFSPEFESRIPTSIDMMERCSCLLQAIHGLCPGQYVQLHNIIGTSCFSPLEGCGDGVVSVRSAEYPFVSTEKRVDTTHRGLHEDNEALAEIMCILQRHILEANDEPCVDESQTVVPECMEPEWTDPCATLAVPDDCVEVPTLADPCQDQSTLYLPVEESEGAIILEGPVQ
jgi:pimeloyl-ACP methyl ester carboxylesterase